MRIIGEQLRTIVANLIDAFAVALTMTRTFAGLYGGLR
jgi:hypothetical protein